ncbi:MAG: DUF928 domain-containing protein [Prochloraceae cyanobacterium]|nr:DUF928 domain-containing protein [Prochloraceae cyanobacterium]
MRVRTSIIIASLVLQIPFLTAKIDEVVAQSLSNIENPSQGESQSSQSQSHTESDTKPTRRRNSRFDDLFEDVNSEVGPTVPENNSREAETSGIRTGASRNCLGENFVVTPIAPDAKGAIITTKYPSFSFQFSQSTSRPVFFSITNQHIIEPLLDKKLENHSSGLVEIPTPTSVQLESGTYYVATLMVVCSEKRPSLNYYVRYPFLYSPSN